MNVSEKTDLELLERLFLRLAHADTDDKLENCLKKFLAPVLLKLGSPHSLVKQKVYDLLAHINKRVRARINIQLPVADLLNQYNDHELSPSIQNFTIIYIKLGYPRLDVNDQINYLDVLVKLLLEKTPQHQAILMQLFISSLSQIIISSEEIKRRFNFFLSNPKKLNVYLLSSMLSCLLLPYSIKTITESIPPPPGMNRQSFNMLTSESLWSGEDIEKIKINIVELLSCGIFDTHLIACPLLVASTDPRYSVKDKAELKMKNILGTEDWNNVMVVKQLYKMFIGTTSAEVNVSEDNRLMACSIQMRIKIIGIFNKSSEAAQHFPSCLQVVFEGLFSANTNSKLKLSTVHFVHHLCLVSSDDVFSKIGPLLHSALLKIVQNSDEDLKVKCNAYLGIGKIGKRCPTLVTKDLSFVLQLFTLIPQSDDELKCSVRDCCLTLMPSLKLADALQLAQLETILLQNIEQDDDICRMLSLRIASSIFQKDHILSKYLLLLSSSDGKEDIVKEATKELHGDENDFFESVRPMFVDFISFINNKAVERMKNNEVHYIGNQILPFKKNTCIEILRYGRKLLCHESIKHCQVLQIEHIQLMQHEDRKLFSPFIHDYVFSLMKCPNTQADIKSSLTYYIQMAVQLLKAFTDPTLVFYLLEIVAVTRESLIEILFEQRDMIKNIVRDSSNAEMISDAAELYAFIVAYYVKTSTSEMDSIINVLKNEILEGQMGSLLCYGFVINKLKLVTDQPIDDVLTISSNSSSLSEVLKFIVTGLVNNLNSNVLLTCYGSLKELALSGSLRSLKNNLSKTMVNDESILQTIKLLKESSTNKSECPDEFSKFFLLTLLLKKIYSNAENNNKLKEKAAQCLGFLCFTDDSLELKRFVIRGLMEAAGPKRFDLHWTIGEVIIMICLGTKSDAYQDMWLTKCVGSEISIQEFKSEEIAYVLNLILDNYMKNPNPSLRQAGGIWLLTLLKTVKGCLNIQSQLMKIQSLFLSHLGENDELSQDVASKGLGIVYERGNEDQRKMLLSYLFDSITTGKRKMLDVTEETALFDESLMKTPDGQGLSTYKELCSIANELNQPDLIYKFMNLANHNASWNFKKGAAYGFSTIASQAGDQLAPYLHKLLPKLYRYQYDPNPRVQSAMRGIWDSLVTDKEKMINSYLQEITNDLKENLTNPQWRIRESSCYALSDLMKGRQLDSIIETLPELWITSFRVRDDIKESVRQAAESALQVLSKVTEKMCDVTNGSSTPTVAEHVSALVIPTLLDSGLSSPVSEVRNLSMQTLMKLSKSIGPCLKVHIPQLVVSLLECISTMEPQLINYLSLHAANDQKTLDKLDKARLSSYKTSPMMGVVNHCLELVDGEVLAQLVPKLLDLMKSTVGVGTKMCGSMVVISLCRQCPDDLIPFTGKILMVLFNGLSDRNATVRRSYADAIGHVAKVSKVTSVEKLLDKLIDWYFEKEESDRDTSGLVVHSLNATSPDLIRNHAAFILPLVFIAMQKHDSQNETSEVACKYWEEVWQEAVPGTEVGIKLYMNEIVNLIQKCMQSTTWMLRKQAASAIICIVEKNSANISIHLVYLMVTSIVQALSGRVWNGKEFLVDSLSSICTACIEQVNGMRDTEESLSIDEVVDVVLKECKKGDVKYKTRALQCLCNIVTKYQINRFDDIIVLVIPILQKDIEGPQNEEDNDYVDKSSKSEHIKAAFLLLSKCWPSDEGCQIKHQEQACNLYMSNVGRHVWQVEIAIMRAIQEFNSRWCVLQREDCCSTYLTLVNSYLSNIIPYFCQFLGNTKNISLRTEALHTIHQLITLVKGCNKLNTVLESTYHEQLSNSLNVLRENDALQELKQQASQINDLFDL